MAQDALYHFRMHALGNQQVRATMLQVVKKALLLDKVLSDNVSVPSTFRIAPPKWPLLLEKVLLETVSVPLFSMPPPLLESPTLPLATITPLRFSVPLAFTYPSSLGIARG
jgi:hypothetical protein